MSIEGINTKPFKYEVGEIVDTHKGKIKLLARMRGKYRPSDRFNCKYYKYECMIDGYVDTISEYSLCHGGGCLVCGGSRVVPGFNDVATTNPEFINNFYNPEDAKRFAISSNSYSDFRCSNCGRKIPHKYVGVVLGRNEEKEVICPLCKDNSIPIGEKIIWSMLLQLDDNFYQDSITEWSGDRRYDFYVPNESLIIEIDGRQHYEESSKNSLWGKKASLEQRQANDKHKEDMAYKNGIQHYVRINATKATYLAIKDNILNSELNSIFDLDSVNWNIVRLDAIPQYGKPILELWNSGCKSTAKIGDQVNLDKSQVSSVLKEYAALGMCDYDPEKARIGYYIPEDENNAGNPKAVICLNTLEIFKKSIYAARKYGATHLCDCLNNKRSYSGKHPETQEKLAWMLLEDYLTKNQIEDRERFIQEHMQEPVYELLPKEYRRKRKNKNEFMRPKYELRTT